MSAATTIPENPTKETGRLTEKWSSYEKKNIGKENVLQTTKEKKEGQRTRLS